MPSIHFWLPRFWPVTCRLPLDGEGNRPDSVTTWPGHPFCPAQSGWEHPHLQPGKGLPWQGQTQVIRCNPALGGGSILSSVGLLCYSPWPQATSQKKHQAYYKEHGDSCGDGCWKESRMSGTLLKVPAFLSLKILYSLRFCREIQMPSQPAHSY